jgi:hypothetical protein
MSQQVAVPAPASTAAAPAVKASHSLTFEPAEFDWVGNFSVTLAERTAAAKAAAAATAAAAASAAAASAAAASAAAATVSSVNAVAAEPAVIGESQDGADSRPHIERSPEPAGSLVSDSKPSTGTCYSHYTNRCLSVSTLHLF